MTKNRYGLKQVVAALGAVAATAVCVFASAAPASAATREDPVAGWVRQVEWRIEGARPDARDRFAPQINGTALVTLRFDATGRFTDAQLAQSSGYRTLDRSAVDLARRLRYPALPVAWAGRPQEVTMRLHFGDGTAPTPIELAQR